MPEDKNAKTVDIDTSGPGAEVEFETKQPEATEIEVSNDKDNVKSVDTSAQSNDQSDVQTSKQETENKDQGTEVVSEDKDNKKELEEYSEGVQKSMRIIMLGGPGSGKSTYSKFLTKEFLIPHVYTGDMMRDLAKQDTPTGRKVRSALDKGDYVDTKIVLDTLQKRLSRKDTERGYVLDGFPRSMEQVKEMEDRGIGYDHAVYLDVAEKEVIRRLMSRGRADDKPEIIKNRIDVYKKQTQPVIDYYKDKLITIKAKGGEQIEDIARLIIKQIKDKDESF